ncbi:MAG: BrnT family toxin [bacterium]
MQYDFEWDTQKTKSNLKKHKVSFERATEIFLDPFMLSLFDRKHSQFEERWISIGKDHDNIALVVVHTFREIDAAHSTIRIISARRATKNEIKQYSAR